MEVKIKLPLETLYVEKMKMPVQIGKNSNEYRDMKGLRLTSIKETVDLVDPLKESCHLQSSRSTTDKIYKILIPVLRELQESLFTLKRGGDHPVLELPENDDEPIKFPPIRLGSRAPRLMRESDVSACMICTRGNRSRGFRSGFYFQLILLLRQKWPGFCFCLLIGSRLYRRKSVLQKIGHFFLKG
jgi:hypothetical protein